MRIAITKPTGKVGTKVVDELLERGGHELYLMTPKPQLVREAVARGARVVQGELEDEKFFTRATRDIDALFLLIPFNPHSENLERDCNRVCDNAVSAVRANKIPRVVLLSSMGAHLAKGTGPIALMREAEKKLEKATENLTILRPVFFMEQFMGWMQDIADNRAFYMPLSEETTVPLIATRDVASVAADILTDDQWTGHRTLPLHGPKEYSYADVATILGKTVGLDLSHIEIEPKEAAGRLLRRGWSQDATDRTLEMYRTLAKGGLVEERPAERQVTDTSFEDFARQDFLPAFRSLAPVKATR